MATTPAIPNMAFYLLLWHQPQPTIELSGCNIYHSGLTSVTNKMK